MNPKSWHWLEYSSMIGEGGDRGIVNLSSFSLLLEPILSAACLVIYFLTLLSVWWYGRKLKCPTRSTHSVIITQHCTRKKIHVKQGKEVALQQGAQTCDFIWFICILSCRFNPMGSQLETVLNFWLINVWMKVCELIKGGLTFGLLAVRDSQSDLVVSDALTT